MKFRLKAEVSAVQFSGMDDYDKICEFVGKKLPQVNNGVIKIIIPASTGYMYIPIGSWIIRDSGGNFSVLSNEIFQMLYEEV